MRPEASHKIGTPEASTHVRVSVTLTSQQCWYCEFWQLLHNMYFLKMNDVAVVSLDRNSCVASQESESGREPPLLLLSET